MASRRASPPPLPTLGFSCTDPLDGADLVVLPALVEPRPRRLLEVAARHSCDRHGRLLQAAGEGVIPMPMGDARALCAAVASVLQREDAVAEGGGRIRAHRPPTAGRGRGAFPPPVG